MEILKFKITNGVFDFTLSKHQKIKVKLIADNLLFVYRNKERFVNDLRINRYLKQLKAEVKKNMVTSVTQGFGTSSPFYYVAQYTLLEILKVELKTLKLKRVTANKKTISGIDTAISYTENDIQYFSQEHFNDKYFSVNGQHRMHSIISDMNGELKKVKTQYPYSPLYLDNEPLLFESISDLRKKLCSADKNIRFPQFKEIDTTKCEHAFEFYLQGCDVMVYEIEHADSFHDISDFIWWSNSSTSWTEFEHAFKQVKNPFTTYFANKISTNDTSQDSELEKLIYKESGIDFNSAKFKKTNGGFEKLCATIYSTAYESSNIELLKKFAFLDEASLLKTLLSPTYVTDESTLKEFHSDMLKISKIFKKLNQAKVNPALKDIYKKQSTFFNCLFLIQYLKKVFKYDYQGNLYKVKVNDSIMENIVSGYCYLATLYNNPMHPINTYFWETGTGKQMLSEIGQDTPFTSVSAIKDDAYKGQFEKFLELCKKNKRDKEDSSMAFSKHIGDSFAFGWNKDHSCVVNMIDSHLKKAFVKVMIEQKNNDKGIFCDLEWEDTTPLPQSQFLLPDTDNGEEAFIESLLTENHRGHKKSKSKGGSNKAENLELENPHTNVITKNVV